MTAAIPHELLWHNLAFLLEETFEGPDRPEGNAYLDREAGWRPTLAGLSAAQASRPVGPDGMTIAAQVGHALLYLETLEAFLAGADPVVDWPGSWRTREVTPEAWDDLRARLLDAYGRLRARLEATTTWDDDSLGDALAILVHSAYHLGAVRQLVRLS